MAVHKHAETDASFDRLTRAEPERRPAGKRWPFGKLVLACAAAGTWVGIVALLKQIL